MGSHEVAVTITRSAFTLHLGGSSAYVTIRMLATASRANPLIDVSPATLLLSPSLPVMLMPSAKLTMVSHSVHAMKVSVVVDSLLRDRVVCQMLRLPCHHLSSLSVRNQLKDLAVC